LPRFGKCRWLPVAASLLCAWPAFAEDTILVPALVGADDLDPGWVSDVEREVIRVLNDNGLVVIDAATARRQLGGLIDDCPATQRPACVRDALMSLPPRVGLQLSMRSEADGRVILSGDFYAEDTAEPVGQLSLPVEHGREARLALQIALFALDTLHEVGPASPGMVQAARHMVAAPTSSTPADPPIRPTPSVDPVWDETLEDDEDPTSATAIAEDEEEAEPIREEEPPSRYLVGLRRAYEARDDEAMAWYQRKAPHAGRFVLEVRGGIGHADVNRLAVSLLGPADQDPRQATWYEGPRKGVGGRVDLFVGYAPTSWFDLGVIAGLWIAKDQITVGYQSDNASPTTSPAVLFTAPRASIQPRTRFWLVQTGIAKPYLGVGVDLTFVGSWRFTPEASSPGGPVEPFQHPSAGLVVSPVGSLGLSIDVDPHVGIVLDGSFLYRTGPLSRNRQAGTLVGTPPALESPAGFTIAPTLGLQFRL
jgi:hypothetical protein